jgi:hypothetical protein
MSGNGRICDASTVKPELRALAILALLALPHAAHANGRLAIPRLVLAEEPTAPTVSFSIPRYTPTLLERQTVAACLVLEAASQGDIGLRGVMAVIRNRARGLPELFAPTVLRDKQFSALNRVTAGRETLEQAILRAQRDPTWVHAMLIVDHAMEESWWDPTGGATHYTLTGERTPWTRRLARTTIIGAHSFYR